MGEELLISVLGNKDSEQLEKTFAVVTLLQGANVAQIAKLLQLQLMSPQSTESVLANEIGFLEDAYQHARLLPQVQYMKACAYLQKC